MKNITEIEIELVKFRKNAGNLSPDFCSIAILMLEWVLND